jgi:hypothetical protein
MTPAYIWVRTTVDWADERAFLAQLPPAFRPQVDLWNATFDVPFREFRREVSRIAQLNLSRVAQAVVAPLHEIPDGALVLPVDDDDWFAPDVAAVLEGQEDPRVCGYFWASSFIEVPIDFRHRLGLLCRALFPRTPPRWLCTTNNYAVVMGPETRGLLELHTSASRWFSGAGAARVNKIERRLSLQNRTLASQTSLGVRRSPITRRALLRKFRRYESLYDAPPPEPDLAWSEPYLKMMASLMGALRPKV